MSNIALKWLKHARGGELSQGNELMQEWHRNTSQEDDIYSTYLSCLVGHAVGVNK